MARLRIPTVEVARRQRIISQAANATDAALGIGISRSALYEFMRNH